MVNGSATPMGVVGTHASGVPDTGSELSSTPEACVPTTRIRVAEPSRRQCA